MRAQAACATYNAKTETINFKARLHSLKNRLVIDRPAVQQLLTC